ncbi:transposase [Domibacillus aminovorans]|uniref:Transposase n=2 Tax=Bacillaceae TaxID=186817 RepID=A0A177KHC6_9BACI|nr:PBECR2 nuclease fold domain-containing protein [Domibacillus aminovorans]OAH52793.1 transposase [Domibacillus aminovorans]
MRRQEKIGLINEIVINILNLPIQRNTPIFSGETNLINMRKDHSEDFEKYGDYLREIIFSPDYISQYSPKRSIEYIKLFYDGEKEEHVLVAVRNSKSGVFYVRSLYVMDEATVLKYQKNGSFKEYKYKKKGSGAKIIL